MLLQGFMNPALFPALFSLLGGICVGSMTTLPMGIATFAYFLMCSGLYFRKTNSMTHAFYMTTAIFTDLSLVLALQILRDAVQTASSFSLPFLQQAHIGASSLATVLYFPVLYLGYHLLTGKSTGHTKRLHKKVAITAFVFRSIGFLLMFSMLAKSN